MASARRLVVASIENTLVVDRQLKCMATAVDNCIGHLSSCCKHLVSTKGSVKLVVGQGWRCSS